jgi:beta-lactamase superfamily II metal-dependent hydrolase
MDPHGQCLAMITDPDGDHTGGLVGIFDIEDKKGWVLKKRPTDPL